MPGKPIASGGIEYGCPSWITTPIGLTLTGIRSARSAGAIRSGRNRARSSAIRAAGGTPVARDGPDRIRLGEPLAQLPLEIGAIEKAPLLEEGAFHPADEILDAAFLLRAIRPAHFDAEPEIERHAGKRRIPLRDHAIAAPLQRDRLRPIEDRHQRNAAKGRDVIDQRAHQRLDPLVGHQRHLGPARVLQPRGKEVHHLLGPVLIAHAHFAEIVLREFARQPFESDQRRHDARRAASAPAHRPRSSRRCSPPAARDGATPPTATSGSSVSACTSTSRYASAFDGRPTCRRARSAALSIVVTAVSAAMRRAVRTDTPLSAAISLPRVPRPPKHLNLVSLEHLDHPFPRRRRNLRRLSGPVGLPAGGQNFRKGGGQNFRNPQA